MFQGVSINGVTQDFTVRKSFDAVHENPLWHNWGPRIAGAYDITGNGKTVAKVSYGRYLDQINTGTPPNPNANINQTYVWNDLNGDFVFQPGSYAWNGTRYVGGEFGNLQTTSNLAIAVFNKTARRPYRKELSVGIDHELFPELLLNVSYLRTREKDIQGKVDQNIDLWPSLYTPITLTDPGRDGVTGTGDDAPITVYNENASNIVTTTSTINDDRLDDPLRRPRHRRHQALQPRLDGARRLHLFAHQGGSDQPGESERGVRERGGRERRARPQLQGERLLRAAVEGRVGGELPAAVRAADHADVGDSLDRPAAGGGDRECRAARQRGAAVAADARPARRPLLPDRRQSPLWS